MAHGLEVVGRHAVGRVAAAERAQRGRQLLEPRQAVDGQLQHLHEANALLREVAVDTGRSAGSSANSAP